tara:strand:+ start:2476 stop:3840 length:1365 start_codon:yes stop_codon:yes gene_type:complete
MSSRTRDLARILGKTEKDNPDNEALSVGGGGGAVEYFETLDSLPISNLSEGQRAFVEGTSRMYVSNGVGWYNTSFVNLAPYFETTPNATYTIADSATPLVVTAKALDSDNPDALISNISFASDSAQYMMRSISVDSSVFTFTPKSADSIGQEVAAGNLNDSNGDFIYTFKWTDGVSFATQVSTITYSPGQTPSQDGSFYLQASTGSTNTRSALSMSAGSLGPHYVFPPDANNGSVTINNVPMYSFVIPGTEPFTLRCYQAQGSGGANSSNGGLGYYFDVTVTPVNPDSKIYMRPGQRGYKSYQTESDQTSGGSGGLGQVWIEDATYTGQSASDGKNVRPIICVAGSGGGNDTRYQGSTTYGASYTSITTNNYLEGYAFNNTGGYYSRGSGASYGGYPNGNAGDDSVTTTTNSNNAVNTTYCSNYSMSSSYYAYYASYSGGSSGKFEFVGKVSLS